LLVARTLEPSVDEPAVRRELDELRDRFVATIPEGASATTLVRFIGGEGFRGADNMQALDPSRIDRVLVTRRGIPITLSIPYLMIGRGLGLTTRGVNFPGHFLLRADGELIDPLNAQLLTQVDVERWLKEGNFTHLGANALAAASADDMALRMFNNVKAIFAASGDFVGALAMIDCQLKLVTDGGALHLERAELWFRLGNSTAAAAVLDSVREQFAGTRWEAEIDKRRRRLGSQPGSTIH
jgi:regulator of sirC expression with transglutaminase-like and TPR domain